MDEGTRNYEEMEIDLSRLFRALWNKAWLIGMAAILCGMMAFAAAHFLVTPRYQSSAMFYVNNGSASLDGTSLGISSGDISASRGLVKSYIVILNSRQTLEAVIASSGVNRSYEEIKDMISAEAVDSTEIFRVVVNSSNPKEAERIATAISQVLPQRISGIIEGSSAKIVDSAVIPSTPSSPDKGKITAIGFAVGLALSVGAVILRTLTDVRIHTEEDVSRNCNYPVLATIPDMIDPVKSGADGKSVAQVGGNISAPAAESYKILRTKLHYSFGNEGKCHVIGVSSAVIGEGKSVSAVNLAYALSQLDKRILLIECDLRRPVLAQLIPIKMHPGLSDYLAGHASGENLLRYCGMEDNAKAFHVVPCGQIPSNPMELLSSDKMERMMQYLRKSYDYIILDLPAVGEVGDAMAAARLTDGFVLVVRKDCCTHVELKEAIRQLEFVGAKILGLVFNCVTEPGRRSCGKSRDMAKEKVYEAAD